MSSEAKCSFCGLSFRALTNKLYCTPACKKAAERERAKLRKLTRRQPQLRRFEDAALARGNWPLVRWCRARQERDRAEIEAISLKYLAKSVG